MRKLQSLSSVIGGIEDDGDTSASEQGLCVFWRIGVCAFVFPIA